MLVPTYDVLDQHDVAHEGTLVHEIADLLSTTPVSSMKDVNRNSWFIDDIRKKLVGDDYDEEVRYDLNVILTELTRPSGRVHGALSNGYVVCTASVLRKVIDSDNGAAYLVKKTARFVTDDDEVAMQYRIGPALRGVQQSATRASEMAADTQRRIPGIAAHMPVAIQRTHRAIRNELPESTD